MANNILLSNFKVTFDSDFISRMYHTTPAQAKLLNEMAHRVHGKVDKALVRKLDKLAKEHPNLPQLRNYLSVAYKEIGQYDKAVEVNEELLRDFPNYLHAKLNAANFCFQKGEPDEALKYLGEQLDLKSLYPERDEFHFSEVQAYYYTTVTYAIAKRDLALAENRLEFYKSIDEDNPRIDELENQVNNFRYALRIQRRNDLKEDFGTFEGRDVPLNEGQERPVFHHAEVNQLYELGFENSVEKLKSLLVLPRKTLIEDLEAVLEDAVNRFHDSIEEGWDIKKHSFVLHAFFLLRELKSESSLLKIKDVLSYNQDFIDFYFGDDLCEIVWLVLFELGKNQLSELEEYLYRKEVQTFTKTEFAVALVQISLHYPEKKNEIEQIFKRLFEYLLDDEQEERPIDPTFIGIAISDIVEISMEELTPLIKELFDRGYVDLDIIGDWKEFEKIANENQDGGVAIRREISSMEEVYNVRWVGYDEENEDRLKEYNFDNFQLPKQVPITTVKIGRNDPCTCGSGKKYKKCCGK